MSRNRLFEDTLEHLPANARRRLGCFADLLNDACRLEPAPYAESWYSDIFGFLASQPRWFAGLLSSYSNEEAVASARLLSLAGSSERLLPRGVPLLLKHARDEKRHQNYFLMLADCVLRPHARLPTFSASDFGADNIAVPRSSKSITEGQLIREIIKINIGEVKNRVHLSLMRKAALEHCSHRNRSLTDRITARLLTDEVNHIVYTATLMEFCDKDLTVPDVGVIYLQEFSNLNAQMTDELRALQIVPINPCA